MIGKTILSARQFWNPTICGQFVDILTSVANIRYDKEPLRMESRASAIDQICSIYNDLSETERLVADFVLQNQSRTTQLSVREIAELSLASGATVSRFVRRMGYASFADDRTSSEA